MSVCDARGRDSGGREVTIGMDALVLRLVPVSVSELQLMDMLRTRKGIRSNANTMLKRYGTRTSDFIIFFIAIKLTSYVYVVSRIFCGVKIL